MHKVNTAKRRSFAEPKATIATLIGLLLVLYGRSPVVAQTLDDELRRQSPADLAQLAKTEGDAARGAVVFFQHQMLCAKCHTVGEGKPSTLGPDLVTLGKDVRDETIVESVLLPSKVIRKGFESVTILTKDGNSLTGIVAERTADTISIRDVARNGELTKLSAADIEQVKENTLSLMPAGQMNQLTSRQQFLDLIKYLTEIRDGGAARARALQPAATLLTFTLPEYEKQIDHAALIGDWNGESLKRGEAIYQRVCANCHGTQDRPGSLPNSLRFAEGKFKNGSEPFAMYQTLTRGFGLMAAQTWMVPSQKYDVIHYIRENYLRPHNPTQLVAVDAAYLRRLPKGNTRGPEPSKIEPWSAMDYGPTLTHTYEIPGGPPNFAYKGIAMRLDPGAGGVSRGRHWMVFDTDTLRMAAGWSGNSKGENFIDWRGIQFNGEHQIHPKIVGPITFANVGPGWANPATGSFQDEQRVVGRDQRRYGPLPRAWGKFHGLYHVGQQAILAYSVGTTNILEMPGLMTRDDAAAEPLFLRTIQCGPRDRDLVLQIAEQESAEMKLVAIEGTGGSVASFARPSVAADSPKPAKLSFDGNTYLEAPATDAFDLTTKDFTIAARLKTTANGTVFALAQPGPKWTPDGQTLFVRDGRLGFDIGWVGAVNGKTKVADGQWHNVAVTWQHADHRLRLFVDGQLDAEGNVAAKATLPNAVARIGFTSPNFPQPESYFQGEIAEVRFWQRRLTDHLNDFAEPKSKDGLIARWLMANATGSDVSDVTGNKHAAAIRRSASDVVDAVHPLLAGFAPQTANAKWSAEQGRLRLTIPAGKDPLTFTIWTGSGEVTTVAKSLPIIPSPDRDLATLMHGGPARWPQQIKTQAVSGPDNGPFAIDILSIPENNPWLAQLRLTGHDFFADGRIAICTWDGDVWLTDCPLGATDLRWQRIASGLFQPLGLKIVNEKIHLTCRDQLVVLHDLNGDGEIDFYECLNNDHQVTEHFHEFAMGLQTDTEGNFYYAKSGRHALPAVVPHHGTLLKVSPDGARTEILATGFRAANGVCLNPDGSFVVTDQEGFWNPKNRINWVTYDPKAKPKFYGNMFGYHDVTDASDSAMEPPLCWITNDFDRSPAELLWVESDKWGPLKGSLLNLSYGYGKVYIVPHEKVGGVMQGGMIELPIPSFPTGVMRGRFHPRDGQLYLSGMFSWAGSATQPGGFFRLRTTGQSIDLPIGLHAKKESIDLTFTEPLDPAAVDAANIAVKTWSLRRTANYGSKHFDEKSLTVSATKLSGDGQTLTLTLPDLQPTWGMEIQYTLRSARGKPINGKIHNTIHQFGD